MSWHSYALIALVVLAFGVGSFVGYSADGLSYDEFFLARQVENIQQGDGLLIHDSLGAQGRELIVLPLVPLALAAISSVVGFSSAFVLFSALIIAAIVALTFFIALQIVRERGAALFSAVCVFCSPALWGLMHAQMQAAGILFALLIVFGFLSIARSGILWLVIIALVCLLFTDTVYVVLVLALLVYVLFLKMEDLHHSLGELEMVVFVVFLCAWVSLITFRKALFDHGAAVLFSNIPAGMLASRVSELAPLPVLFSMGIAQALLGFWALYVFVFRAKKKEVYLPLSLLLVLFFVASLGVMDRVVWQGFAAVILSILAGMGVRVLAEYGAKTHFKALIPYGFAAVLIVVIAPLALMLLTPVQVDGPSPDDIAALEWVGARTPPQAVIMAPSQEGFAIEFVAKRQTVSDRRFTLLPDAEQRFMDANTIFSSATAETDAVRILNKYNAHFIFVSERSGRMLPPYFANDRCFQRVFDRGARVYAVRCEVTSFA